MGDSQVAPSAAIWFCCVLFQPVSVVTPSCPCPTCVNAWLHYRRCTSPAALQLGNPCSLSLEALARGCNANCLSLFTVARLFVQLVDLFQFYMMFPIDDHTGDPVSDEHVTAAHYEKVQQVGSQTFMSTRCICTAKSISSAILTKHLSPVSSMLSNLGPFSCPKTRAHLLVCMPSRLQQPSRSAKASKAWFVGSLVSYTLIQSQSALHFASGSARYAKSVEWFAAMFVCWPSQVQRLFFKHVHKLRDLALANCGSVEKRDTLRKYLNLLEPEELKFLVTQQLRYGQQL